MTATGEQQALITRLESQRAHVLGIVDDLDEDTLRRPMVPSGWSCQDVVHHLAIDVERFWFRAVMGGDPAAIETFADDGGAWRVPPGLSAADVFTLYRDEAKMGAAAVAGMNLEDGPTWWPDRFGPWRHGRLRDVMLHVIIDTATHAGHLDVVREQHDGRQWLVLD